MTDYKLRHYHFKDTKVSKKVQNYFRNLEIKITESINIMRIDEDVILTKGNVEKHTDNTVKGKDTIMLIINSDGGYIFRYPTCDITLRTGDIIRFNGNEMHSLTAMNRESHFCAIIWDVPLNTSLDDLIYEFNDRVKELESKFIKKIK